MRNKFLKANINLRDFKNYVVSIITGAIVGVVCIFFRIMILKIEHLRTGFLINSWSPYLKFPLFIIVIYILMMGVYYLILKDPLIAGNGAEQARGMLNGHIQYKGIFRHLINKLAGSTASLGMGIGLGREGPSIQFGSYIGILLSKFFRITPGRIEYIISAGSSAGVAASLDAPLAGPVYIIESLQKFNNYRIAICSLLAGMVAGIMAKTWLTYDPYAPIIVKHPDISAYETILILVIMGVVMAVAGLLFTECVKWWRMRIDLRLKDVRLRLLIMAVGMGLIAVKLPGLLGSGQTFMINEAVSGNNEFHRSVILFVITFLFVAYSQAISFPGGAFFPLLTLGGMFGKFFAIVLIELGYVGHESVSFFMIAGMNAAIVIIMRTPLTGLLLVAEMCNQFSMLLPALVVSYTGYFLISIVKTESLPANFYNMLLKRIHAGEEKQLHIYTEVMPNSYFEGKTNKNINLPSGCVLDTVLRDNKEISFSGDETLRAGDQLKCLVDSGETAIIYQSLLSLSSEAE